VAGETTPEPPCSSAPARKTKVTNSGAASDRNAYMVARAVSRPRTTKARRSK